jgi:hypothetical protein
MTDPLEPLDPAVGALLDAERTTEPSDAAIHRIWSHVERSVGMADIGGVRHEASLRAGHATLGPSWVASHAGALVALAFAAGGALGVGATLLLRRPVDRILYVDRPGVPAPPPSSEAPPPASGEAPQPAAPLVATAVQCPSAAPPRLRAAPGPSAMSFLPAERSILDDARAALARGDGAVALALAEEHRRLFAHPQLHEEREAVAIQAMVLDGHYVEARARAAQFRAASPDSLFLPAVEASLASIP